MKNKNKNFGYAYRCKGWRSANRKKTNKTLFAIFAVYLFVFGVGMMIKTIYEVGHEGQGAAVIEVVRPAQAHEVEKKPLTARELVAELLDRAGVDQKFKNDFLCLVQHESGFNPEASSAVVLKNGKISVDRGIMQINSQVPPFQITNSCAYDLECSVNKSISYLKETGNWFKWYGWKYNCQ